MKRANATPLEGLFSGVQSWAEPVLAAIGEDVVLRNYALEKRFQEDLRVIVDAAYHMNFVEDSEASTDIHLANLLKYPRNVQERFLRALRQGTDLCGYIFKRIDCFEQKARQRA